MGFSSRIKENFPSLGRERSPRFRNRNGDSEGGAEVPTRLYFLKSGGKREDQQGWKGTISAHQKIEITFSGMGGEETRQDLDIDIRYRGWRSPPIGTDEW